MTDSILSDTTADTADTTAADNTTADQTNTTTAAVNTAANETKPAADTTAVKETTADDWATLRTKLAGDDKKILDRLSRYSTLDEAIKAGIEAQNKIGSIKANKPLTKDSTPEEIKAYREAHNIPETAKYELNLPGGLVLGEADKPIAEKVMEVAHQHNVPTEALNAIIAQHLTAQAEMQAAERTRDEEQYVKSQVALKSAEAWGSEYDLNVNAIKNLLNGAPKEVTEQLIGARMPDGTILGNHPETLKWLSSLARQINPLATITPHAGQTSMDTLHSRISAIEGIMKTDPDRYWKGAEGNKLQEELRGLYDIQQRASKAA